MDISLLTAFGFDDAVIDIWRKDYPHLLPIQSRAISDFGLFSGQNLLIFAPTSSGKTFVGEMAAVGAARRKERTLYLLPLRALAEEKFETFRSRYSGLGLKVVVSSRDRREYDRQIEQGDFDVAVVVFEKMDALLLSRPTLLSNVGLVIVDEMQMLLDESRGARLELLLAKMLKMAEDTTQIIALSAVLENSESIRDWVGARLLKETSRPVELRKGVFFGGTFHYVLHNEGLEGKETFDVPHDISDGSTTLCLVKELVGRGEQCLVFLRDKTSTMEMARAFAEESTLRPAESAVSELRGLSEQSPSNELLLALLANGIAYHNADLSQQQRTVIERAFKRNEVVAIFSTTTLALGVNLPAKNVIIDAKRWRFSKRFGQMHLVDITRMEYENLAGRAGRLAFEPDFGRSILVASAAFDGQRLMEKYVRGQFETAAPKLTEMPLEDVALNVIASGLARSLGSLRDFLAGTFTGRVVWSKEGPPTNQATGKAPSDGLSDALERLSQRGMLRLEEREIAATTLGAIVARAGISAEAGTVFARWATESRGRVPTELDLLLLIAQSADAGSVYLPLAVSEWQQDKYLNSLKMTASTHSCLDGPIVARFLDQERRPSFEETRAIKRALLMLDWIHEEPLAEIESKYYNTWPGLIQRLGETAAWLCDSLIEICRHLNWPTASLSLWERLPRRLVFGVYEDALPLAEFLGRKASRSTVRNLVKAGLSTQKKLRSAGTATLTEIVGYDAAGALVLRLGIGEAPPVLPKTDTPDERRDEGSASRVESEAGDASADMVIRPRDMTARFKGVEVTLRPKAMKLLLLLAKRAPHFVHKEEIYESLWGASEPDCYPYEKQIADHKAKLVKALLEAAERSDNVTGQEVRELIDSRYGIGYRLCLSQKQIEVVDD